MYFTTKSSILSIQPKKSAILTDEAAHPKHIQYRQINCRLVVNAVTFMMYSRLNELNLCAYLS